MSEEQRSVLESWLEGLTWPMPQPCCAESFVQEDIPCSISGPSRQLARDEGTYWKRERGKSRLCGDTTSGAHRKCHHQAATLQLHSGIFGKMASSKVACKPNTL